MLECLGAVAFRDLLDVGRYEVTSCVDAGEGVNTKIMTPKTRTKLQYKLMVLMNTPPVLTAEA